VVSVINNGFGATLFEGGEFGEGASNSAFEGDGDPLQEVVGAMEFDFEVN